MSFDTLIPTSKRIESLQYENPWWTKGNVQQPYRDMHKRLYYNLFYLFAKTPSAEKAIDKVKEMYRADEIEVDSDDYDSTEIEEFAE